MLNLTEMQATINDGRSVIFGGQIITQLADLPTAPQIAAAALAAEQQAINNDFPFGCLGVGLIDAGVGTKQNFYSPEDGYKAIVTGFVARDLKGGVAQEETATVAGTVGASGAGNAKAIVTANGLTGSPLTVTFAVANNDTAAQVAGKARTALGLNANIAAFFEVLGSTTAVKLKSKTIAPNDGTMNIEIDNDTSTGITHVASSANTTGGADLAGVVSIGTNGAANNVMSAVNLTGLTSEGGTSLQAVNTGASVEVEAGEDLGIIVGTPSAGLTFEIDVMGFLRAA